jgi:hypothetical protein
MLKHSRCACFRFEGQIFLESARYLKRRVDYSTVILPVTGTDSPYERGQVGEQVKPSPQKSRLKYHSLNIDL